MDGASFSKKEHRIFCDALSWLTLFFVMANQKRSWRGINFLEIAKRSIAEDDPKKKFSSCGGKLILGNF